MAAAVPGGCPLTTLPRFCAACPSIVARKRGKRCLDASRVGNNSDITQLSPLVQVHQHPTATQYFTYLKFLTPNNLLDRSAYDAFMRAVVRVGPCVSSAHSLGHDDYEVCIVLSCVSEHRLKFYYYIVDHRGKRIHWNHHVPREVTASDSQAMRNEAEYWYHRKRFPTHKLCTQEDRGSLIGYLNSLHQPSVMPVDEIRTHVSTLNQLGSSMDVPATCQICEIYVEALKRSLPGFDDVRPQSKLRKTLYGLSKFKALLHSASHSNTPAQSPRSSASSSVE